MQSIPTPESVVKTEVMGQHMTKFHLGHNKVLHRFSSADKGYPHNHPFGFRTSILSGGYIEDEYVPRADGSHEVVRHIRLPGTTHEVKADTVHLLVELLEAECYTLIEPGEKVQESSFFDFDHPEGPKQCFWHGMANGDWRPLSA